jgi:hypothetical protein
MRIIAISIMKFHLGKYEALNRITIHLIFLMHSDELPAASGPACIFRKLLKFCNSELLPYQIAEIVAA